MIRRLQQELVSGDQVGRYRLIAELARGGMGIVYLAAARGTLGWSRLVALKQLRPDLVEDSGFLAMFLDEARVAARLSHPNIVQTNDVEQSDGRYFIAMEYLDGRSLSQILRRLVPKGGLPEHVSLFMARDALSALDYAHSFAVDGKPVGVVHRDISPQNILVTFEGCAKVIDFGIAKARDSVFETRTGVLKGKVHYMAPEQLAQRAEPRSDLFAMGVVLHELVTGQRFWSGLSEMEIMGRLARADVPPVSTALSPGLHEICRRALCVRVEDRFDSAAKMRDALDEHLWAARLSPDCRDVGALLSAEFGAERDATRAAIDAAMEESHGNGAALHSLGLRTPFEASRVAEQPSPGTQAAPDAESAFQLRSQRARLVFAIGLPALLLVGLLIGLGWRSSPHAEAPALPGMAPAEPLVERTATPAPAAPSMIAFSVNVSPSSARVLIDGQPMPSNPFLGRFAKDYAVHRVRANAAGYVSKERIVSFADNVMVDLSLDPRPAQLPAIVLSARRREPVPSHRAPPPPPPEPTVRATPPAPPAAKPAPPTDIVPRRSGEGLTRRAIDANNPYGEDQ